MSYWNYYDDDFEWTNLRLCSVDPHLTIPVLLEAGIPEDKAKLHGDSGYVYCEMSKTIIDRYYGGALMSRDPRCRWSPEKLRQRSWHPPNQVEVHEANSWEEVLAIVGKYRSLIRHPRRLFFRGQTKNYTLVRQIPNPSYEVKGIGEISLIPSLWRRMLVKHASSFHEFNPPEELFWHVVLDKYFDMDELERRRAALCEAGEWIHSFGDMEDCSDAILNEYGGLQLDLAYGSNFNLASTLATLLQHYGMLSPVLDLTTDFEVARFFATHRLNSAARHYDFVGTNGQESVLYILKEDSREMDEHKQAERIVEKFGALRPQRQNCVISRTSSMSLNLPAEFLIAVIRLKFEDTDGPNFDPKYLFPGPEGDQFLHALLSVPISASRVISFTS